MLAERDIVAVGALFVPSVVDAEIGVTPHLYTAADILGGIVRASAQTTPIVGNLDTGANLDTALLAHGAILTTGINWSLINDNTGTGAITLTAATGHTIVGNPVVAALTSVTFRTARTAANTWVTYRLT